MLEGLILGICRPSLDDTGVKGLLSDYGGQEAMPAVHKYVLEHIRNLDKVLFNLDHTGATISGEKS